MCPSCFPRHAPCVLFGGFFYTTAQTPVRAGSLTRHAGRRAQIYAPIGHALGLGPLSAELEDRCFQVGPAGSLGSARSIHAHAGRLPGGCALA
jgi:hypothetical protein